MARITALEAECSKDDCKVRAVVQGIYKNEHAGPGPVWCQRHGVHELLDERVDLITRADLGCQSDGCKAKAVLVVLTDDEKTVKRTCKVHALKLLMDSDDADKRAHAKAAKGKGK